MTDLNNTANTVHPTAGQKLEGTAERAAGHMLPGTELGHQLKADGALHKGDLHTEHKAESHMGRAHESVPTGQYLKGTAERAAGHMLPGTEIGHKLKAEGAMDKGDIAKAERAASHLKNPTNIAEVQAHGAKGVHHQR